MHRQGPTPEEVESVRVLEAQRTSEAGTRQRLGNVVLGRVASGIWHTTSTERFRGILETGAILPEPVLPDAERWSTSAGPQWYPYVRTLGGVSLFDFRGFEPEAYRRRLPLSSWAEFVPYRDIWGCAVWIEIATDRLGPAFISGADLLARWKSSGVGNRIMPEIEAAHIGPIPADAIASAFMARRGTTDLVPLDLCTPFSAP